MITARCPHSCTNGEFITTAHVMEEWKVDEHGEFIEVITSLETTHGPDSANIWSCVGCGAQAIVKET